MGALYQFTCESCAYSADVSGRPDAGMVSETQTIHCLDCNELADALVKDERNHAVALKCPKCFGVHVQPWNAGDKCPRCKGKMKRGKLVLVWD